MTQRPYPFGVLITYWDLRCKPAWTPNVWLDAYAAARLPRPKIVIDSGVYSARTKGESINVGEYARWLASQNWRGQLVAGVDVDWPASETAVRKNTAVIRRAVGAEHVWPVLHPFLSDAAVESYCAGHSWCAVGSWGCGIVGGDAVEYAYSPDASDRRFRWFEHCHRIAARHGTRLHALGVGGSREVLDRFPWASADCSLIGVVRRFGGTYLWLDGRLRHCGASTRVRPLSESAGEAFARARISVRRCIEDKHYRAGVTLWSAAQMEAHYAGRNPFGFRLFVAEIHPNYMVPAMRIAIGLAHRKREGTFTT